MFFVDRQPVVPDDGWGLIERIEVVVVEAFEKQNSRVLVFVDAFLDVLPLWKIFQIRIILFDDLVSAGIVVVIILFGIVLYKLLVMLIESQIVQINLILLYLCCIKDIFFAFRGDMRSNCLDFNPFKAFVVEVILLFKIGGNYAVVVDLVGVVRRV